MLAPGLWAFDGWDQTNYVAGEMKNPEKNIPRAIHTSMAIVIVCLPRFPLRSDFNARLKTLFLCANLSYFVLLDPVSESKIIAVPLLILVRGESTVERSNTVALDFGHALFGKAGGIIFACMVAFSCVGALNG